MNRQIVRRSYISFFATVILSLVASHAVAQVPSWKDIKIPALHTFKPQQPKRIELPNGMVIMLQEDHELPIIDGFARIRGGSREEPAEKIGLVDTFGDAWRTGGTKTKTGDELDDFLEARAAKVETGAMLDSTKATPVTTGFTKSRPRTGSCVIWSVLRMPPGDSSEPSFSPTTAPAPNISPLCNR